jgi:hypothetical protein
VLRRRGRLLFRRGWTLNITKRKLCRMSDLNLGADDPANDLASWVLDQLLPPALSVSRDRGSATSPPVLFHFTSAAGLLGMVRSRSVWASLASSLNDASEQIYARQLVRAVVSAKPAGISQTLLQSIASLLDGNPGPGIQVEPMRVFVASFCDSESSSAQWLHYGRNGTGFALSFVAAQLALSPFFLAPVEYEETVQRDLVLETLRRVDNHVPEVAVAIGPELAYGYASVMALAGMEALAPFLKSAAFKSEREWRLMTYQLISDPNAGEELEIDFHESVGRIVPHGIRRFGTSLPLSEIVVGYSNAMGADDDCFKMLLPGVPVRRSAVPVRP